MNSFSSEKVSCVYTHQLYIYIRTFAQLSADVYIYLKHIALLTYFYDKHWHFYLHKFINWGEKVYTRGECSRLTLYDH